MLRKRVHWPSTGSMYRLVSLHGWKDLSDSVQKVVPSALNTGMSVPTMEIRSMSSEYCSSYFIRASFYHLQGQGRPYLPLRCKSLNFSRVQCLRTAVSIETQFSREPGEMIVFVYVYHALSMLDRSD